MADARERLEQYLSDHLHDWDDENSLLSEVAYNRLYDAIRNLELEPGEPLSTVWLSKVLGISRTPIREALQQLAVDGLVQMNRGRAVTNSARSPQEVYDALHVRELLEPESIRLCATEMSIEAKNRLQALMDRMIIAAREEDRASWSRADQQWHEILCTDCPNPLLGQMVLQARHRMYHRGSDENVSAKYLIQGTEEHRQIQVAIVAGDGDRAAQLTRDHLQQLKENIFRRYIRS